MTTKIKPIIRHQRYSITAKREKEMKNEKHEPLWQEEAKDGKIPEIVQKEPNDKPASLNLRWTIVISIAILAIIYLIFFH